MVQFFEDGLMDIINKYPEVKDALKRGEAPEDEAFIDEAIMYCYEKGDMPYGIAKARDGDPDEWALEKVYEVCPYDKNYR